MPKDNEKDIIINDNLEDSESISDGANENKEEKMDTEQKEKKKTFVLSKKMLMPIIAVVLAVVVAIILAVALGGKKDSPDGTNNGTESTSSNSATSDIEIDVPAEAADSTDGVVASFITAVFVDKSDESVYKVYSTVDQREGELIFSGYADALGADEIEDMRIAVKEQTLATCQSWIDGGNEPISDKLGDNYTVDYVIAEATPYSTDKVDEINEGLVCSVYDPVGGKHNTVQIATYQAVSEIHLNCTAVSGEQTVTFEVVLLAVQEDDGWRIAQCEYKF